MTGQVEKISTHPMVQLKNYLDERTGELANALPKHIPPEKFIRVVLTAVQLNPNLLTCTRQSLWNACMRAANDGLIPDGREGAIVPFKDTAQWMPMVGGLLKRFRNSGQFRSIATGIVRTGEFFERWVDENGEHMKHVPGDGTGKPIKAYALAQTVDGGVMIEVMTEAEIDKRKNVSRAKNSPLWTEWVDEAWKKTVLRNLSKRLPSSADIDEMMRRDDDEDAFERVPPLTGNASAALDHFAADRPKEPPQDEIDEAIEYYRESGEQPGAESASEFNEQPDPPADPNSPFERGRAAKKQGLQRRAVPPEFRTPDRTSDAKNWVAGWDSVDK